MKMVCVYVCVKLRCGEMGADGIINAMRRLSNWENEYEYKLKWKRVGAHKLWNKFHDSPNIQA